MKNFITLSLALMPMMASADTLDISSLKAANLLTDSNAGASYTALENATNALRPKKLARANKDPAKIEELIGNWVFTYDIVDTKASRLVAYTDRLILSNLKSSADGDISGQGFVHEDYTNVGLATECVYNPALLGEFGDYYCLNFAASGEFVHAYIFKFINEDEITGYYSIGKNLEQAITNAQAKVTKLDGIREPIARYDGNTKLLSLPRVAVRNVPGFPGTQIATKFLNYGNYVFGFPPADIK